MRRVLVDGVAVDVGGGEAPRLILNNPALADLNEIKLNRTTSYDLPATERNRAVLGLVGEVMALTDFPRRYHSFEEQRDGVPVIQGGRARVLSVSRDSITLSVTWGVLREVKELLSRDLRDLPSMSKPWNSTTGWAGTLPVPVNPDTLDTRYGWVQYDSLGEGASPDIKYTLPGARVDHLLDLIGGITGFKIAYPAELATVFKALWVPCLTSRWEEDPATATRAAEVRMRSLYFAWEESPDQGFTVSAWRAPTWWVDRDVPGFLVNAEFLNGGKAITYPDPDEAPVMVLYLPKGDYRAVFDATFNVAPYDVPTRIVINTPADSGASYRVAAGAEVKVTGASVDFSASKKLVAAFSAEVRQLDNGKLLRAFDPEKGDTMRVTLLPVASQTVYPSARFDITGNLPGMTCLEFLRSLAALYGLYVTSDGDGVLRLNRFRDLLYYRDDRVVDLGERLARRLPDEVTYSFADYAKINHFRYAADESVSVSADASIAVDDDTLPDEKEVIALPFAPCDARPDGLAIIPVYARDEREIIQFNGDKLKPRIVGIDGQAVTGRAWKATFELGWPAMLQHQELLRRLLASPRVVKLTVRVTPVDLNAWASTVPVFYYKGRYWLYVTITAAADGTAEVEMVEIGEEEV
jgi:hypothetical protein